MFNLVVSMWTTWSIAFFPQLFFFWHKKVSLRAGIEPAREDPIWFRGQRLYHSAITSDAIKLSALCSVSSFQWNHLTRGFLSKAGSLKHKKISLRAEFEPAREDPIGFRVQRLNRSAIAACANKLSALCSTSSFQCQPLEALLSFHSWFFYTKRSRCEQESNLRVKIPLDFESNALTTRPSHLMEISRVRYVQPRRFNGTTWRMAFFPKLVLFNTKRSRCEQDSNLRGKIPLDFKPNALTTRPSQLVQLSWVRYVQPRRFNVNHLKHCFLSTVVFLTQKGLAASRNWRCAGRSHLISTPTPLPLGHHIWCN